jgi:ABC-type multidrug transport system fused ATPase/permease subunit
VVLILYLRKDLSQCNAIDAAIFRVFRGLSNKKAHPDGLRRSNQAAKHALLKFLRSLSDQQLFFGLALSLVTYIKMADPDGFSAYSFKMATTTIWLSCLTHISTIIALSDDKPYVTGSRGWRVAAIAVLFLLLAPILVISNLPTFVLDPSLSLRCAWNGIPSYNREQTLNFALTAALALAMVIRGYSRAFRLLYRNRAAEEQAEEERTVREQAAKERATEKRTVRDQAAKEQSTEERSTEEQAALPLDPRRKFELAIWIEDSNRQPESPRISWRVLLLESLCEVEQSFFWQLMWLMFYYTFGITSLVVVWTLLPPLKQWSLSYGQLVPAVSFVFAFPPLYDDFQGKLLDRHSIAYGADHDTEENTNKNQVAVSESPPPAGSESGDGTESDTNELVAQSPHGQDHKSSYPSWQRETDIYQKSRLRLEAFNAHKKDEGFTQVGH